jgi:hypothetical protein
MDPSTYIYRVQVDMQDSAMNDELRMSLFGVRDTAY